MSTSLSKTPAPKKDRIYGSKLNPKGSASSEKSAKSIKLSGDIIVALTNKLKEFKEKHPNSKNIGIADLKAVYRRGLGAYSSSHRPTISGGKPNTRNAWAMARVNKFLLKAGGTKVKAAYVQDDDLMKMHLGGDMSKHLAPNGKPSNLTHEQWHMVRTPIFKAWFGDWEKDPKNASKVVDENGEPLVVYRGSKTKNPNYIPHKHDLSEGIYFSSDKNVAELYTTSVWQNWVGRVFECFLNVKNLMVFDTLKLKTNSYQADFKFYNNLVLQNKNKCDGIRWDNFIDIPDLRDIYPNEPNDFIATTFIVFEPNQIKLADGTNTTFDGSNPDIRYADGGEADEYVFLRFGLPNKNAKGKFTNSYSYIQGRKGVEEGGISVFEAIKVKNGYEVFLSNSKLRTSFDELLRSNVDLYIVDGEDSGNEGFDGEILLDAKSFKVIKKINKKNVSEYNPKIGYKDGGEVDDHKETYAKWKSLVNMSKSELEKFYNSEEGKVAGLKPSEAKAQGIDSGRESARWIMKMKDTPTSEWTPQMWKWAKKQISFISRMSGNKGGLYDDKGRKTRKHLSLLIWGNNPEKKNNGGSLQNESYPYLPTHLIKVSPSKLFMPNVRGGWTKDKIVKYFKAHGSDTISTFRLTKYISEFDSWQDLKNHIYYHGTQSYISKGLKPSITMSEREAERSGGGGYGQRYFGVSLTKRKRTAESFSGMSSGVTIYPMILKRDAKVIERIDLQDASEIEDIIVDLYEQGVDAVWIGGGEEELVVVNPYSILLYDKGSEYHSVYGGFKSVPLSDDDIKEMYDKSKILWQQYSEEYRIKQNQEEKRMFLRSLPKIQFKDGGTINKNINFMEQNKFASLPHIDTINNGDKVILHEQVFSGDLEKPRHIGSRYIVCEVMGRGGMTNSLNLKVDKSIGTNALNGGSTITRPISVVLAKGKKYLVEPIKKGVSSFKDGGELNPDNKQVKQFFAHDSGNAGGVLVGKRHSEGGIKAINKSTGQPIEMEGGEVVITRGAVSNPKKYSFSGKEMTTREILSNLNVDGGGVSFAEGGDVPDKIKCGCSHMDLGGTTMTPQDFIRMSEKEYEENRLIQGIEKERKDHFYTLAKLNAGAITIEQALKEIAIKEMMLDAKYPFGE